MTQQTRSILGHDAEGAELVMRKRDYMADAVGQFGQALMSNIVGQLTYFYTDKIGLAVASVGVVLALAKVFDAVLNIVIGNFIDHSKGGNRKYYRWMIRMAIPAAVFTVLIFTVPHGIGEFWQLAYVLATNAIFTGIIYCLIATPFNAVLVVRTKSQKERSTMGVLRAAGSYLGGMGISLVTIPVTNMLGGNQAAWVKFSIVIALLTPLSLLVCYLNGRNALYATDNADVGAADGVEQEDENVPFGTAVGMLFRNRYWVIVLLFSLLNSTTNTIAQSGGVYYAKWIFGNDNLVSLIGAFGVAATVVGLLVSQPLITKLGIRNTMYFGLLGAAIAAAVRCLMPTNFIVYTITSVIGSFVQIPLISLYGVLPAMTVDYNEYKYDRKLVGLTSGVNSFSGTIGAGLGSILLSGFLAWGHYDASLATATTSMRWSIYGFSNFLPIVINLFLFFLFTRFDLEEKLPAMRAEVAKRHAGANTDNGTASDPTSTGNGSGTPSHDIRE